MSVILTAMIAGGVGAALGSAVRFRMIGVGESTPMFKPQQDFPDLAEWPPEVPSESDYEGTYDVPWGNSALDVPQLVHKGPTPPLGFENPEEVSAGLEALTDSGDDDISIRHSLLVSPGEEDEPLQDVGDIPSSVNDQLSVIEGSDADELTVETNTENVVETPPSSFSDTRVQNYPLDSSTFSSGETVAEENVEDVDQASE